MSRSQFTSATLKALYTLKDAGFSAYVVGGGVRDLLAGLEPKDFDIATDAKPEEIKKLFRSCRLVGRRFLIAHVRFGREIVEVTTFRGPISDSHERDDGGRILSDNVYGTLEQDAFRRDFTVNGLYYDIRDFSIVDHVGGVEDLRARTLRLIGDPEVRYREDAVRMLRAVRIGNKLHFRIDPSCAEPIPRLAPLLREIPPARLFDEILKVLFAADAVENFRALHWFGLWRELFPQTDAAMAHEPEAVRALIEGALGGTADRVRRGDPVSPAFLFAAMLWVPVRDRARALQDQQGHSPAIAWQQAGEEVIAKQVQRIALPRRFSTPAREIWSLQLHMEHRRGKRAQRLLKHPRLRAAFDLMKLRVLTGEPVQGLVEWWADAMDGHMPEVPEAAAEPRRRRRSKSAEG